MKVKENTYTTEVINDKGTLAIMRDGWDILYVNPSEAALSLTDVREKEHQRLINVIVAAFANYVPDES